MADVSHELGSIRHIVDTPLSSKVAMFNKVANQHNASQLLNPFANVDGRASPKPTFSKDEYGKPIAGSLTEMRGQKANIHVWKEMLELCQVINSEGFPDQENPDLRIIFFGDLFNIYNYISDKVVGLLLRARKHKLVDFEGEMLFQRRDDEVPIFLLKPIKEIRATLDAKQEELRRSVSPAPKPTTVLQDQMKINKVAKSAPTSKAPSPQPEISKLCKPIPIKLSLNDNDKLITEPQLPAIVNNAIIPAVEVKSPSTEQNINSIPVTINVIEAIKDENLGNIIVNHINPIIEPKVNEIIDAQLKENECKSLSSTTQTENLIQENNVEQSQQSNILIKLDPIVQLKEVQLTPTETINSENEKEQILKIIKAEPVIAPVSLNPKENDINSLINELAPQ